uniref:Uncharacterized protein n=1 Tax=Rhizophora mucronata TaxID=61149 RepID=A0A2P2N1X4_RHIMU
MNSLMCCPQGTTTLIAIGILISDSGAIYELPIFIPSTII